MQKRNVEILFGETDLKWNKNLIKARFWINEKHSDLLRRLELRSVEDQTVAGGRDDAVAVGAALRILATQERRQVEVAIVHCKVQRRCARRQLNIRLIIPSIST